MNTRSRSVVTVIISSEVITDPAFSPHNLGPGLLREGFLLAHNSMLMES
jgi:hypothetical protein